jgi:hypothetical protein
MAITITVSITDADQAVLLNDLLDIDAWVQAAVVGKVANCKTRMATEAASALKADPSISTMPATDDGLCAALMARDGYQNRAARDAA